MKVVYANVHFGARHGEAIAGQHILRALNAVATVSAVVSYDRPERKVLRRDELPPAEKWYFPRPPGKLLRRRGRGLKRWLDNLLRYRGWRRRFFAPYPTSRTCEAIVINGGSALHLCESLLSDRSCPALLVVHAPARRLSAGPRQEQGADTFFRRARGVKALAFVSRKVEKDWLESGLLQGQSTYYLPNCCDEEEVTRIAELDRADLRRRLGLPLEREIVICLAGVLERKGQDLVVSQLESLLRQRPNLHVIFVGRINDHWGAFDDRWSRDLVEQVESGDYSERCRFLGEKPDALEYLRSSDLLVLPSRREALPLVLLEAMAMRVPIVASEIDGIPEAVVDGETGILFEMDDDAAMTDAIVRLLASPELREEMTARGHQRYWASFSRENQRQKLAEILSHLVS